MKKQSKRARLYRQCQLTTPSQIYRSSLAFLLRCRHHQRHQLRVLLNQIRIMSEIHLYKLRLNRFEIWLKVLLKANRDLSTGGSFPIRSVCITYVYVLIIHRCGHDFLNCRCRKSLCSVKIIFTNKSIRYQ